MRACTCKAEEQHAYVSCICSVLGGAYPASEGAAPERGLSLVAWVPSLRLDRRRKRSMYGILAGTLSSSRIDVTPGVPAGVPAGAVKVGVEAAQQLLAILLHRRGGRALGCGARVGTLGDSRVTSAAEKVASGCGLAACLLLAIECFACVMKKRSGNRGGCAG